MLQSMGSERVGHDLATEQKHNNTLVSKCSGSPGAVLHPRKYLEISGDIFGCYNWGAIVIQGVAATVYRTASNNKELLDPKCQ